MKEEEACDCSLTETSVYVFYPLMTRWPQRPQRSTARESSLNIILVGRSNIALVYLASNDSAHEASFIQPLRLSLLDSFITYAWLVFPLSLQLYIYTVASATHSNFLLIKLHRHYVCKDNLFNRQKMVHQK